MGFWNNVFGKAADTVYSTAMNFQQASAEYLAKNPQLASFLAANNADLAPSSLPKEYDNVPYCTVLNGKMVHTIGEYKAECAKTEWDYL